MAQIWKETKNGITSPNAGCAGFLQALFLDNETGANEETGGEGQDQALDVVRGHALGPAPRDRDLRHGRNPKAWSFWQSNLRKPSGSIPYDPFNCTGSSSLMRMGGNWDQKRGRQLQRGRKNTEGNEICVSENGFREIPRNIQREAVIWLLYFCLNNL